MSRLVFCRKYQQELPGLPQPPFPGDKGREIYDNVSLQAWQDWQKEQVMLINEKHLSMASAEDRKFLQEQMDRFLSNQQHERASGYVPPD
ncbi:MAG: oxidative damage protection protein [Pseudomonadales bacterium]|nr:oxidative damage protection protein [Pseudomonadales bacterium]